VYIFEPGTLVSEFGFLTSPSSPYTEQFVFHVSTRKEKKRKEKKNIRVTAIKAIYCIGMGDVGRGMGIYRTLLID
jgi:hypothetical protein